MWFGMDLDSGWGLGLGLGCFGETFPSSAASGTSVPLRLSAGAAVAPVAPFPFLRLLPKWPGA